MRVVKTREELTTRNKLIPEAVKKTKEPTSEEAKKKAGLKTSEQTMETKAKPKVQLKKVDAVASNHYKEQWD